MITSRRAYLEAILELGQAEKRAVVLMGGTGNLCSSRNTRSQTSSRGKPKSRNCIGCWEATFVRGIYMEMGEEETKGGVVAKTFSNWTSKWLEDWDSKEHVRCSTFLILYEAEKEKKTRKEKRREKHIVEDGVEWEERNTKGCWLVIFFWSLPSTVNSIAFLSFFRSSASIIEEPLLQPPLSSKMNLLRHPRFLPHWAKAASFRCNFRYTFPLELSNLPVQPFISNKCFKILWQYFINF